MKTIKILILLINLILANNILSMAPPAVMTPAQVRAKIADDSRNNFIERGVALYLQEDMRDLFKKIKEFVESDKYRFLKLNNLPRLRNSNGQTLLYLAIEAMREDVVKLLLDNEESVYEIDGQNRNALEVAEKIKNDLEQKLKQYAGLSDDNYAQETKAKLEQRLVRINQIIDLIKEYEKTLIMAPVFTRVFFTRANDGTENALAMPKALVDVMTSYLESAQQAPQPEASANQQVAQAVAPEGCGTGDCVIA